MNAELIELAIDEDNKKFWEYVNIGEFRMQKCSNCGKFRYPCAWLCPYCNSEQYSWELVNGTGEVFTWTALYKDYHPAFKNKTPYNISVIQLDEGIHFLSNVECRVDEIKIGMKVKSVIRDLEEGYKIIQFVPIGG